MVYGLSCSKAMWDLPRPELEPVSPALTGRFLTTAPPGKPGYYLDMYCVPCLMEIFENINQKLLAEQLNHSFVHSFILKEYLFVAYLLNAWCSIVES